ncbi:MAG: DUF6273 domain-containing protein [Propionibacteriaceae bacterium]|jgi:hypothetical protein|nr:DUF6273 domain-containing protein [Propionibacteriaceae bacterium]
MDWETALRKIEELNAGTVEGTSQTRERLKATMKEKTDKETSALNSQIAELTRLRNGLDGFATTKVREFDQQISDIRVKIAALEAVLDQDIRALPKESEPLEWDLLYLDEEGARALVVSRHCVARKPFDTNGSGKWQSSSLRSWLNKEFYGSLPAHVRSRVLETPIDGGTDRVFLLSKEEAQVYFAGDSQRVATFLGDVGWWWLRSPGGGQDGPAGVGSYGNVDDIGDDVYNVSGAGGVRPALWLDLNA